MSQSLYFIFVLTLLVPAKGSVFYVDLTKNNIDFFLLENQAYTVEINDDGSIQGEWVIRRKDEKKTTRKISGEFTVYYSSKDPQYGFGKRATGGSPVANRGEGNENNVWNQAKTIELSPTEFQLDGNSIPINYSGNELFSFSATFSVPKDEGVSVISWKLDSKTNGYFAVVYSGLEERTPDKLDFLYHPLILSWKCLPEQAILTPESFSTTPSVFTTQKKITEGLVIPSAEIPYRFASAENSRFGLILRTDTGQAKPMVMAPILGGTESYRKKYYL